MRIACSFFSFWLVLSCGAQSVPSGFREDVIAELSEGAELGQITHSAHHLAWVEKREERIIVRLDGKQQGGVYDEVRRLGLSPDEAHLAFIAKRDTKWVLVYDAKEYSKESSLVTAFEWQPQGSSFVYSACQGKKCHLFVDGAATGAEYEEITYPQYSDDGKHLAYLGKRSKKWMALVDGKETGPEMDAVDFRHWGFNPGGSRFYVATSPQLGFRKIEWMYVVDGATGPGFDVVSRIAFSRDGKHYAYAGATAKGFVKNKPRGALVLDGQSQGTFEGKSFYQGQMVTGALDFEPEFHGLSNPEFDPDGKVVYAARREAGDVAVFVGDHAGPPFDDIVSPLIFSADGRHFAYVAQQGENFVEVRDNKPGEKFPGKRAVAFVSWIYVTDEPVHHLAYEIVRGGANFARGDTNRALRRVVIDSQAGPEYNVSSLVGFRFNHDFTHYGYEIHGIEGNRARVRIDAQESKSYDLVAFWSLTFAADPGTASFIARDGQKLLRVSLAIH